MSEAMIRQSGEGEVLNVVGERIRILADSAMTDGKCVIFENISEPGSGPPLHRHGRDDEFFFVVEGTVKFLVDGQESVVSAGGAALAPRGSVHAFANVGTQPSRMIITCCPGGLEGPFREADRLQREGRVSPESLAEVFGRFDLEILGPPLESHPDA
jgi:mannose-6-phosphate isomerase-like protein (cupin superfamily)